MAAVARQTGERDSSTRHRQTTEPPAVTNIRLEQFTAFNELDLLPCRGINVLVGANATGKTHLLKVAYAACDATQKGKRFADKLTGVFLPAGGQIGRLAKRRRGVTSALAEVTIGDFVTYTTFSSRTRRPQDAEESLPRRTIFGSSSGARTSDISSAYIPVKEMLANAPGFRSLYAERAIHFEEIYNDLLDRAYLPSLRGAPDVERRPLLKRLHRELGGRILVEDEEFYWEGRQGKLEFTLLAEGLRKLGLLWRLIQNGVLPEGSVLFWDEPEANLNPKLLEPLVGVLLELQRLGVQVFVATHDYVLLKQLDLQQEDADEVRFHALHREGDNIVCNSTDAYLDIEPNAIDEAFGEIYDAEVKRHLRHR